jgi:hypothetical protein
MDIGLKKRRGEREKGRKGEREKGGLREGLAPKNSVKYISA